MYERGKGVVGLASRSPTGGGAAIRIFSPLSVNFYKYFYLLYGSDDTFSVLNFSFRTLKQ